jgi:hypothetical protein
MAAHCQDHTGRHAAASNRAGTTYIYQTANMAAPAEQPRLTIAA